MNVIKNFRSDRNRLCCQWSTQSTAYPGIIVTATNVKAISTYKITCTFKIPTTAALGLSSVKVTNADNLSGTKLNTFTVNA
jgi:hypothetical protein